MSVELDPKKIFEVLVDALRDAYKELIDLGLKISGVVLIVLGWFASQKNPLSFLCDSPMLVALALLLVAIGFGLICFLFVLVHDRAAQAYGQLVARGYDIWLFSRFQVTTVTLAGGIAGQALLFCGICFYLVFKYYLRVDTTCAGT